MEKNPYFVCAMFLKFLLMLFAMLRFNFPKNCLTKIQTIFIVGIKIRINHCLKGSLVIFTCFNYFNSMGRNKIPCLQLDCEFSLTKG